jgi:hypothetical protein
VNRQGNTQSRDTDLNEDVPIAIVVEGVCVQNFKFWDIPSTSLTLMNQLFVREGPLRILVEEFHVGVCWRRVEVPVEFFDVLAMITLMTGNTKKTFFEDTILAVP